jgi:4-amino-4-deoxy-L-arabinose transferase-like glycosyltransferase
VTVSLAYLEVFPAVGEDEPWIAAAPYKLATEGVYGSDLFAGYYGVERHNYQHMPLYPLLQAAVFKVFGVGVFQMRMLPVLFGFFLILVVFAAGRVVGGTRVGALAAVLMCVQRIGSNETGILLLDRARINRYDIAVPVFALLGWLAFERAQRDHWNGWYFAAGVLVGAASLCHLYGGFWFPVLVGLLIYRRGWTVACDSAPWLLFAGLALAWAPWLGYIATGWSDFRNQMRFVWPRFDLLDPSFYVANVLQGGGPISLDWVVARVRELPLSSAGAWTLVAGLPAAFTIGLWQSRGRRDDAVRQLALASAAQLMLFVVLLRVKTINYMIAIWPLGALLMAWLGVWLWDRRQSLLRGGLLLLLGLLLLEGGSRIVHAASVASRTTPYDRYTGEVARCIPSGSLVLGLQHYWLGLRQFPYRTWLVPANYAHPVYFHEPMGLDRAIERVDPDVILIDRHMARLFESTADPGHDFHHLYLGFEAFKQRHPLEQVCVIRDDTYGTMEVYRRR